MGEESNGGSVHSAWLPGPSAQIYKAPEAEEHRHTQRQEIELPLFIMHGTERRILETVCRDDAYFINSPTGTVT